MKKILLSFAHPDDETFGCGGTVAKYVKEGWKVTLLLATRGEAGNRGPYEDVTGDLGDIRSEEVEKAGSVLGIHKVTYLGHKDGKLSKLSPGELEEAVYKTMREEKPDVVITFDRTGISNHPDHIKMCVATTFAFQKYARDCVEPEHIGSRDSFRRYQLLHGKPKEVTDPKLYYIVMPESVLRYGINNGAFPEESFGAKRIGTPDDRITTVIDISRAWKTKLAAFAQHKSQSAEIDRFVSLPNHPLFREEFFILRMQGVNEVFFGKNDRVSNSL